jgi:hypothetical protein
MSNTPCSDENAVVLIEDPREVNLPKWVQARLELLRMRLREAATAADEARLATDPDDSDTLLLRYTDGPIGLGRTPRIRFYLEGSSRSREFIDVRLRSDRSGGRMQLDVYSHGTLVLLPRAANRVALILED